AAQGSSGRFPVTSDGSVSDGGGRGVRHTTDSRRPATVSSVTQVCAGGVPVVAWRKGQVSWLRRCALAPSLPRFAPDDGGERCMRGFAPKIFERGGTMRARVRGVGGSRIGWVIGSAVALGALIVAGAARAQFVVDDFEQDGFVLEASNGDVDTFQSASAVYFDGFRTVYLQGFDEPASTLTSAPGDGDDALVLTTGGGAIVRLTYGSGSPNADLSGFAAIEVVVTQAPSAGALSVRFTNPGASASASTALDGPGIYRFELDDMNTTNGFDFTEVDRIS